MNGERLIYIDFMQCVRALFKKWSTLLAMAGVGMLLVGAVTFLLADQEDTYQATSSVYCVGDGNFSETAENVQMMNIYVDIIRSSRVAERANSILGNAYPEAESILSMITVDCGEENSSVYSIPVNSNSIVIKLIAESVNEQEAIDVANAMAEAFVMEMSMILSSGDIQLLDDARTATVVYEAEKQNVIYMIIGALVGFFLAAVWIVMKEIFSVNLNTVNDGTLFGKLDVIGVIPEFTQR